MRLIGYGRAAAAASFAIGAVLSSSMAEATSLGGRCSNWMSTSLAHQSTGKPDLAATQAACVALEQSGDFVTSFIERGATCLVCAISDWTAAGIEDEAEGEVDENEGNIDVAATEALERLGITIPDDAVSSVTPQYSTSCTGGDYDYDRRPIYITVPADSTNCPGDGSLERGWKKTSPNRDIDGTRNYRWCALCTTPDTYWRSGIGCCAKRN